VSHRVIDFALRECSLGWLLIAASERGICSVRFGDSEEALEEALRTELLFAVLERSDVRLKPWSDVLISRVEGNPPRQGQKAEPAVELPFDVSASSFQRRVWDALQQIPRGETRAYSEVADSLGVASGARAVARACAANPVAVLVPCHRVVSKDGGLGGYRWGLERKRALLAAERGTLTTVGKPAARLISRA
jgi:AraC family transcriptional regulator of adaptative response/methylated-DNA-[protein]-cysteine methyltransferase